MTRAELLRRELLQARPFARRVENGLVDAADMPSFKKDVVASSGVLFDAACRYLGLHRAAFLSRLIVRLGHSDRRAKGNGRLN